jgi:hypothetical protein
LGYARRSPVLPYLNEIPLDIRGCDCARI